MTVPGRPADFGRVDSDGTVFVRTNGAERAVGQVPGVPPEEALSFFVRRFEALDLEVSLLETRVRSGALSPNDALAAIRIVLGTIAEAKAVGDFDALLDRLNDLLPEIAEKRASKKAERARQSEQARAAKERLASEAERLAVGQDWRGGVNRFRALLEEWKALPRLDRVTDDELWHRFSTARTTYTRRRKTQFAAQAEQREAARVTKEKLVAEAEQLATSTDWGPTSGAYRDLMGRWKAAGPAPRAVEEALWRRFRAAQDTFFGARAASNAAEEAQYRSNAEAKEKLLVEGEALVPVTDVAQARASYRDLLERWSGIGKVPRELVKSYENRLRAIETAIKRAEEERWRRDNPEARGRAQDTAAKLHTQIEQLEAQAEEAAGAGDQESATEARASAATYRSWLEQAQRAARDFGG